MIRTRTRHVSRVSLEAAGQAEQDDGSIILRFSPWRRSALVIAQAAAAKIAFLDRVFCGDRASKMVVVQLI